MKTKDDYQKGRQAAADLLAEFNRKACIHFAEVLRKHDEYKRLSAELGVASPDLIPQQYFEVVYKILSLGKLADRAVLIFGTADDIEGLISETQRRGGFSDEKGFFIEV